MTVLLSDETEWSRALNCDDQAFGELFQRHHHRVFRHTLRLVVLPADADEVMASAFLELWRRRTQVRLVDGSVLPWLLVTATNLSRNRIRGALRYQRVLSRLPHDLPEDAAATAAESLERHDLRRRIIHALRQVSATDAALITLTALDGLSTAEAAAAVGVTPGAARTRLSRSRGHLRELLQDVRQPIAHPRPLEGPS